MTDTTFVKTAWHYQTYEDFFRLAELSGYPVIPLSELNPTDDSKTYIITPYNGDWQQGFPDARARIIHWDLEWRRKSDYPHNIPGIAETWASDAWYAMQNGTRYVTLGSHPDLPLHPLPEKPELPRWDVAFLAYMNPRRQVIADWLRRKDVTIAPNGWGEERHNILTHVRAMVHVHQWDEFKCIAPQRWAVAAAYKLPIFSEDCYALNTGIDDPYFSSYEKLSATVSNNLHSADLPEYGERFYQQLCVKYPFRHCVDAAVEALERFGVV